MARRFAILPRGLWLPGAALRECYVLGMHWNPDWNWQWFITWPLEVLAILAIGLLILALLRHLIHILTERIAIGYYRAYADAIDEQIEDGVGTHVAAEAAGLSTTAIAQIRPRRRPLIVVDNYTGGNSPAVQRRRAQRARTVGSVLQSAANVVVVVTMAMMILSVLGYQGIATHLLASAGVFGIAIGFGAQSLVRDFLSGLFILIEDQYGVGDEVDLGGGAIGVVEKMDLRLTHVRSFNGTLWHVRNGEILRAGNKTQQWSRAVAEVRVPAGSDRGAVRKALGRAVDKVTADLDYYPLLLETPNVRGIDALTDGNYLFTIHGKVRPGSDGDVSRALLDYAHEELVREGVIGA